MNVVCCLSALVSNLHCSTVKTFGNVQVCQIFEFVESIGARLTSFSQPPSLDKGIIKDPTVWLNGARPPLSTFSKIA
jgi:hypothetical protein